MNTPLLAREGERSSGFQHTSVSLTRWGFLIFVLSVLVAISGIRHIVKPGQGHSQPLPTNRVDQVWACASKLSSSRVEQKKHDQVMTKAVNWFVVGAGQNINVPETSECDWSTPFAVLYALIIIREELSVPDKSWHTDKPLVDPSDACRWKRLKCDSNNNVVALTLNHGNISGTIPLELTNGLMNLTRLYFYSNNFLVGNLPSELGKLEQLEEIFVHKTNLEGTIPSELGRLTLLNQLLLDNTRLCGTMPEEICQLRAANLNDLRADCRGDGQVQCDHPECCTSCLS